MKAIKRRLPFMGGGGQKMSIKLILLERMKQEPANYALLLLPCGKCVCVCVSVWGCLSLPTHRPEPDLMSSARSHGRAPQLPDSSSQTHPVTTSEQIAASVYVRTGEVEIEFIHNKCDTATVRVRARQRLFMRASGHPLRLVMLRRTSACLKLGRRCLSAVAVCHREIITHPAKYIFKMIVVRFLMARCVVRSTGGKVNCGVVNVCSCSRYKLCDSNILARHFVFIERLLNKCLLIVVVSGYSSTYLKEFIYQKYICIPNLAIKWATY